MARSSFENVSALLREGQANRPAELDDDVEIIVRRYDRVRDLGAAFDQVELSPYMRTLLQTREQALVAVETEHATAAAGS